MALAMPFRGRALAGRCICESTYKAVDWGAMVAAGMFVLRLDAATWPLQAGPWLHGPPLASHATTSTELITLCN